MTSSRNSLWILILKGILAGLLFALGSILTGMFAAAVHVAIPNFNPVTSNPQTMFLMFLLACPMIGLALLPLARGTKGTRAVRWVVFTALLLICLGVNTVIEMLIYTTAFAHGGAAALTATFVLPALFCALVLASLGDRQPNEPAVSEMARTFFTAHAAGGWIWRFVLAILAFPVVYFVFGMMVAPFVVDTYRAGIAGLVLPPISTIIPVQILRSSLFLLASLPLIILWKKSRGSLIFSLGLAHWVLVGLFGLVQALWFPPVLRIAHSLEIGADSFAYAAALVLLFLPRRSEGRVSAAAHVAHELPS